LGFIAFWCGQMLCSTAADANCEAADSTSFLCNGISEMSAHAFPQICFVGPLVPA
jgi:hypothetical protein